MLLEIENLGVEVAGKRVLKDVNLSIAEGETHVLLGPNGAGKSTLFLTVLGFPQYEVVQGSIKFKGQDITKLTTAERVKLGIGVSFQTPPSIRGVSVRDLLKIESHQDMDEELNPRMQQLAKQLKFSDEFLDRDVNLGFSGGEVKRSEIFSYWLKCLISQCLMNRIPVWILKMLNYWLLKLVLCLIRTNHRVQEIEADC
jgi:Fe-S cluster assembly ATP-binding protein